MKNTDEEFRESLPDTADDQGYDRTAWKLPSLIGLLLIAILMGLVVLELGRAWLQ